jgi:aromatic ring-opening dioxygenase LigB subunit
MISSAYITPHPPIIIPGIGRPEDLKQVKKTVDAMEKLRADLEKANPDTILIISPHAPTDPNGFLINSEAELKGSFADFGLDEYFSFQNDYEIMEKIGYQSDMAGILVHFHSSFLDHGALVPLHYLTKNIKPKIIHCSFSFLDFQTHFRYGEIIGKILREAGKKIAIVASGDLSHRLKEGAPAGYSPEGKKFDEHLIKMLSQRDISGILNFDPNLVEEAGECGLRSIIMLLGILQGKYEFCCLNYEGPFGVGYLVAELKL